MYLAATAALLAAALHLAGGHFAYALDDAYIHRAVARNLVDHGVWGVTRHAFTSSTSSLAWPLLLAAARAVGISLEVAPLLLNVLSGLALIAVAAAAVTGTPAFRAAVLLAVVFLTPLPTLALSGMEHTLHAAAVLALGLLLGRAFEGEARVGLLAAAGAASTAARYESLFVLAAAVVALVVRRQKAPALALAAGGALPVALYAAASLAKGWPPVPNSLLLKGVPLSLSAEAAGELLGGRLVRGLTAAPHLLVLIVLVGLFAAWSPRPSARPLGAVFVAAALLHLQMADVGWLFRYEAYLVAWGLVLLAALLPAPGGGALAGMPRGSRALGAAALLVAAIPLLSRAAQAAVEGPRACRNVFEQQVQMGRFLAAHYRGATVMANDIGAVSDLADVRLVDLYGLATRETAAARRRGGLDRPFLDALTAATRPEVIVVYRSWFAGSIPDSWIEVGTWRVPDKVVVADRTVTFLAADEPAARRLREALLAFQPELPPRVVARIGGP